VHDQVEDVVDEVDGYDGEGSTPEVTTTTRKKAKKPKATKKAKAKGKAKPKKAGTPRGRLVYSLRAGIDVKEYDPKTHEGAVVVAMSKLGEGESNEIIQQVEKSGFKTKMKSGIPGAVRFALWNLSHEGGVLKTRSKTKAEKAAA